MQSYYEFCIIVWVKKFVSDQLLTWAKTIVIKNNEILEILVNLILEFGRL